jgi:hypothetical protein
VSCLPAARTPESGGPHDVRIQNTGVKLHHPVIGDLDLPFEEVVLKFVELRLRPGDHQAALTVSF